MTRGGDVARIAPRPSHLHLSAAIALSELSAKRYLVDVGIQVGTGLGRYRFENSLAFHRVKYT